MPGANYSDEVPHTEVSPADIERLLYAIKVAYHCADENFQTQAATHNRQLHAALRELARYRNHAAKGA